MRAVLWDLDGTLIDSEEYHWLAWRDTLLGEGLTITRPDFGRTFGWRNDAVLRALLGPSVSTADIGRISDAKEVGYRRLVRDGGLVLLPGVRDWLIRLQADGWQQAIASSAPRLNLDAVLETLEVGHIFGAIVSADEVEHGKPDPALFLSAAARLNVTPARCVVVEDAPAGIEAAQRAGMHTIGVLTSQANLEADVVVRRLDDLPRDAFEGLVAGTEVEVRPAMDDTAMNVVSAITARDWIGLRLLLHPYLHWTSVDGSVIRGRQKVMAMLEQTSGVDRPDAIELRDGQIYRWRCG